MPVLRLVVLFALCAAGQACRSRLVVPPAPSCIATTAPPPARPPMLDGTHSWWQVPIPYTLVVNNERVAIVKTEADSLIAASAWAKIDVATIKTVDVVRSPRAQEQEPTAIGALVLVTMCR